MADEELLRQIAIANEARIEARERMCSQSHAEALLRKISDFLGGWDFNAVDVECATEAEALDAEIGTLFTYGWPLAQYPARSIEEDGK